MSSHVLEGVRRLPFTLASDYCSARGVQSVKNSHKIFCTFSRGSSSFSTTLHASAVEGCGFDHRCGTLRRNLRAILPSSDLLALKSRGTWLKRRSSHFSLVMKQHGSRSERNAFTHQYLLDKEEPLHASSSA